MAALSGLPKNPKREDLVSWVQREGKVSKREADDIVAHATQWTSFQDSDQLAGYLHSRISLYQQDQKKAADTKAKQQASAAQQYTDAKRVAGLLHAMGLYHGPTDRKTLLGSQNDFTYALAQYQQQRGLKDRGVLTDDTVKDVDKALQFIGGQKPTFGTTGTDSRRRQAAAPAAVPASPAAPAGAPRTYTPQELAQAASQAGFSGPALTQAVAIALAETGGESRQSQYPGEQSFGVTQINVPSHPGYDPQKLNSDPVYAFRAMYAISKGGKDFSQWSTVSGNSKIGLAPGAYQKQMATAAAATGGSAGTPGAITSGGGTIPGSTGDEQAIQQAYGYISHLQDIPELKGILETAAAQHWDTATIDAAVRNSDWARSHRQTQVQWEMDQRLHPAEANAQKAQLKLQIQKQATELGFSLTDKRLDTVAGYALNMGLNADELDKMVKAEFHYNPSAAAGSTATQAQGLRALAKAYLVPLDDTAIGSWEDKILHGEATEDTFKEYLRVQSKGMFPQLAGQIDGGMDPTTLLNPYKGIAQRELGVPDIDWSDPKWLGPLMQTDPKTGTRTMPTLDQWQTTLRTDPKYGWAQTTNAQNMTADFGEKLLANMGAV